ncbi:hypothetical protein D3C71_1929070 [compost metagenome]
MVDIRAQGEVNYIGSISDRFLNTRDYNRCWTGTVRAKYAIRVQIHLRCNIQYCTGYMSAM